MKSALMSIAMVAGGLASAVAGDYKDVNGFAGYDFRQDGKSIPYRLLIPKGVEAGKSYPLILSMHGMGSVGSDNAKQLFTTGMIASNPVVKAEKVFILAPQCPESDRWVKVPFWNEAKHVLPSEPTQSMKLAMAALDHVIATNPIDRSRIYVGGASMGAFATWELIARRPGFFAAAFPVCGGACVDEAAAIAKTPVWAFHGDADDTVHPRNSREAVEAIRKAGGKATYTEYPGVKHDAWNPAFKDQELFRWLFSQRNKNSPGS